MFTPLTNVRTVELSMKEGLGTSGCKRQHPGQAISHDKGFFEIIVM